MADIKLFNIKGSVQELQSGTVNLEKELQTVIERNMKNFFEITFLASEYSTTNGGRMDSLGIDENFCPVIFEYKRDVKENVINQGLFYLDWLLDHKDSFKLLVLEKLGSKVAEQIDWSMPRVICIANDFTKYDESAIKQMNRNITLIRYRKFEGDLLMFEQVNENVIRISSENADATKKRKSTDKTFEQQYESVPDKIKNLYDDVRNYILALGDDITETKLKLYTAFKKMKNIICAELSPSKITLYLKLPVDSISYETGFSRDASNVGHWGTGDVELTIKESADFQKAKSLIERAYSEN
ncbi:MAG: hypothetical protein IJ630_00980 [Treponema sp.]|nr:hypothetical protein [Treponema sp.]